MHLNENTWGSGPKHGATTSETKRYMDFAAQYGFDGVLKAGMVVGSITAMYSALRRLTLILISMRLHNTVTIKMSV
jgi:hypothetical protein